MILTGEKLPLKEDVPYEDAIASQVIRIRWVQAQCYEIKLPNGKTIVTDPFFQQALPGKSSYYSIPHGINVDSFEGCDYVLMNHPHADHILNLGDIYRKFEPLIICDTRYAFEISECFDIPFGKIFPVSMNQSYLFEDFRLNTYPAIHNPMGKLSGATMPPDVSEHMFGEAGAGLGKLDAMGCLANMNFLFTLHNRFKIGFAAGTDIANLAEAWRINGPDLLLRQRMVFAEAEEFADEVDRLGGTIALPIHHEVAFSHNADMHAFVDQANQALRERKSSAKILNPKRMQWYQISVGIQEI